MSPRGTNDHRRLGDILIQHKLIDRSQLEKALAQQQEYRRQRFIGEILVELRAVSPEQLEREVRRIGRLGELLLRKGTITPQQLDMGLKIQKDADRHRYLGDILLELGFVKDEELEEVVDELVEDIVKRGIVSENQLKLARELQKRSKRMPPLGEILIRLGFITEDQMISVFSRYAGIPFLRIARQKIEKSVRDLIPTYIIRRRKVIPLNRMGKLLTLAMVNPFDTETIKMLEELLNIKVNPVVCSEQDFQTVLAKYFRGPITTTIPTFKEGNISPVPRKGPHAL
ncbi:MAG: GspE/PulE/PilB domain-containing protein [Planctomycetota bacterium]|jgi:type IV pilus assembly protein PilB